MATASFDSAPGAPRALPAIEKADPRRLRQNGHVEMIDLAAARPHQMAGMGEELVGGRAAPRLVGGPSVTGSMAKAVDLFFSGRATLSRPAPVAPRRSAAIAPLALLLRLGRWR